MESATETNSGLLSEIEVLQAIYADSILVLPADGSSLGTIIWHPSSVTEDVEFEFKLPGKKSSCLNGLPSIKCGEWLDDLREKQAIGRTEWSALDFYGGALSSLGQ